jgi:hypothetical protein
MGSSRNSSQYFQPKVDSNPIAHRVRRKRQRLPSSLIENASDRDSAPAQNCAPRRFRSRLATIRKVSRAGGSNTDYYNSTEARCQTKGLNTGWTSTANSTLVVD